MQYLIWCWYPPFSSAVGFDILGPPKVELRLEQLPGEFVAVEHRRFPIGRGMILPQARLQFVQQVVHR